MTNSRDGLPNTKIVAVIIYDGHCGFCRAQAGRLSGGDGRIALRSFHDDGVLDDYPMLTYESCTQAMKLVLRNGHIYEGAEAVARALTIRYGALGRLWLLYYVPGVRQLLDALYRWVAANRRSIEECDTGQCRRHGQ